MLRYVALSAVLVVGPRLGRAQGLRLPPPETALGLHFIGIPQVTCSSGYAMGGAFAANTQEPSTGNPAALAGHPDQLTALYSWVPFAAAPDLRNHVLTYVTPLGEEAALEIYANRLSGGAMVGGVLQEFESSYFGAKYARRISSKWRVGFGTGELRPRMTFDAPAPVGRVAVLKGKHRGLGGRLGLLYEGDHSDSWGLCYDDYKQSIERLSPFLPAPQTTHYHSKVLRVGMSFPLGPQSRFALDVEKNRTTGGGGFVFTDTIVGFGAEHRAGPFAYRAGLYSGQLTGGVGYYANGWSVEWAFTGRFKQNLPGLGAEAAHYLSARAEL